MEDWLTRVVLTDSYTYKGEIERKVEMEEDRKKRDGIHVVKVVHIRQRRN